jgi:hypothetical protein
VFLSAVFLHGRKVQKLSRGARHQTPDR